MGDNVPYGRYEEAYRAIHSALSGIMAPPPGRKITKLSFSWNGDGTLATLKAYEGDSEIFTLTFTWNLDGTLKEVNRTNA
ncbi:MAG: hypothetical protein QHH17_01785 [Candidatus Bathyarchaeota archaeon]|jgi:hypothetical protein|nr:hypothetical protein [Candidatus Bathyarchaeota archaeon]